MAKKWKFELNEQLLREMGREAVAEAAAQAGAAERALTLAHRLVPIIQAALKEGYAPKEIAAVLRKLADAGDEAQEEEDERR
jgi:hypothetical protein